MTRNFIKYWLPVAVWTGVILGMSTGAFSSDQTSRFIVPLINFLFPGLPPGDVEMIHGLVRRAGHVGEYFVLGLLLFRAFRGDSSERWRVRWAIYAIVGAALCAAGDEYHQSFVATRTGSIVDVGIDAAGGFLSQIAVALRQICRRQ